MKNPAWKPQKIIKEQIRNFWTICILWGISCSAARQAALIALCCDNTKAKGDLEQGSFGEIDVSWDHVKRDK